MVHRYMLRMLVQLYRGESALAATEYAVMLCFIVLGAFAALMLLSEQIKTVFERAAEGW
jgi:Flp pilus assembly pilin Flp